MTRLEAVLARSEVFGSLDDGVHRRLIHAAVRTVVATGDVVLRQGEAGDSLFIVVVGSFEVRVLHGTDPAVVTDTIGPGGVIGELQLIAGGTASATVVAVEQAEVLRLSRPDFDAICEACPDLLEVIAGVARERLRRHQLLQVLPAILGPLDSGLLATIERQAEWLRLQRGEVLFQRGDPGDAWYVVTSGRLAVVEPSGDGQPGRLVAEAGRGEAIGELALLTGEPRSATVHALRDTELVRFPMGEFLGLLRAAPQAMDAVLRTLAGRLVRRAGPPVQREVAGVTLTLVPAAPGVAVSAFAQCLAAALATWGPTRVVSAGDLEEVGVGRGGGHRHAAHAAWVRLGTWLEAQSATHRFLVLVADESFTDWSARAVDHADQVVLVADATGDASPGPLERDALPSGTSCRQPRRVLALHRDGSRPPQGTAPWLDARTIDAHVHVRLDRPDDVERLARVVAGRGLSLVLSGGGARGFAQLGVVRAMRELGPTLPSGSSLERLYAAAVRTQAW